MPQPTLGPPNAMRKAGQHRLPGGQERLRPGVLGLGGKSGPRFESEVTLQVRMYILGYELTTWKKSRRISPAEDELGREVT